MRSLILSTIVILVGTITASAAIEPLQIALNANLSGALSGTTSTGLIFGELPKSAAYGLMGAGFLVLTVIRRRNNITKLVKRRI